MQPEVGMRFHKPVQNFKKGDFIYVHASEATSQCRF
jgi:hypothetical protein